MNNATDQNGATLYRNVQRDADIRSDSMTTIKASFSGGMACFTFSDKPSAAVRSALKANHYRWWPSGGYWWSRTVRGGADLLDALQKIIDREAGVRRIDGACRDCGCAEGYWRQYAARTYCLCDACNVKQSARELSQFGGVDTDRLYEDQCAAACGL